MQFAQADSRSNGAIHPGVIVELAVDHDLAGRFTDEPQLRHRATLLGKLRALAPQSFEEFVDQRETPAIHRTGIDVRFRGGEEFQNVIDLRLVFLHLLPVCFAVFKEGPHLVLRRAVEQTAVLAKQRVNVLLFASPIHSRVEVDEEVIEADSVLIEVVLDREPDVLALRDSFEGIDARTHRVRREGRQIPAAISEGIIFEVDQRVVGLRDPAFAQLAKLFLLLRLVVPRDSPADDRDDDVRFQLRDLQRRQRVNSVCTVQHLAVGMRLADLLRHAVYEAPDVIGEQPALVPFR